MADELRPIHTPDDHAWALSELERLWGATKGTPEGNRFDILATLIDVYESKAFPMDDPDPIEAIRFRMEQMGLSRKDLEPMIGSRARIAEVFSGKRQLSVPMMRRLNAALGIPADILLRPARTSERPKPAGKASSRARMAKRIKA